MTLGDKLRALARQADDADETRKAVTDSLSMGSVEASEMLATQGNGLLRLRAEVRDLKARLKAARGLLPYMSNFTAMSGAAEAIARITDLRVKNWRAK